MLNKKCDDMKSKKKKEIKRTVPVPDHLEKKLKEAKESFEKLSPQKKEKEE